MLDLQDRVHRSDERLSGPDSWDKDKRCLPLPSSPAILVDNKDLGMQGLAIGEESKLACCMQQ